MKFEEWEPYYEEILSFFSFDRKKDEEAAEFLDHLMIRDDLPMLIERTAGNHVTVCGNAPGLPGEIGQIRGTVFAADAAAIVLAEHGIRPDAVFTDLDGADETFQDMNWQGTIMVIHAHGDNMYLLRYWVPRLIGPVIGTTQSKPLPHIYNFGGFSDGDRAVFAAHELGASSVSLVGFDCDDPSVGPVKRGKLIWARKLLALLGHVC
ncbi:MAG TPA: 6-hydroxymethylpterin diphosphokinase MptE-like protein [Methanoregulaceae archaeon]|nr:6-hydroxymethylpterin diphosphokinase MptE-like protein [Methanoregulaceae archaeon]